MTTSNHSLLFVPSFLIITWFNSHRSEIQLVLQFKKAVLRVVLAKYQSFHLINFLTILAIFAFKNGSKKGTSFKLSTINYILILPSLICIPNIIVSKHHVFHLLTPTSSEFVQFRPQKWILFVNPMIFSKIVIMLIYLWSF